MGGKTSIEDEGMPLHPNKPSPYEKVSMKKNIVKLELRIFHH
jgi:hypothetical protein